MLAPLDTLEDDDLLARLRAGDEVAFDALVDRHRPWLVRFCTRLLGDDAHAAEDAAQESLLKLHASVLRDGRPLRIRAWLTVVARNTCFDQQRRRRPDLPGVLPERAVHSDDPFALDAALAEAWPRLAGRHREVLYLREVLGFSYKEIGSVMGLSVPAVETLVFRARAALRREYEKAGGRNVACGLFGFHLLRRHFAVPETVPGAAAAEPLWTNLTARLTQILTTLPGCGEQAVAKVLSVAAGVVVAAAAVLPGVGPFADSPAGALAAPALQVASMAVPEEAPVGQPASLRALLGDSVPAGWSPQRSRPSTAPTVTAASRPELVAAAAPPSPKAPLRDALAGARTSDRPTLRRDDDKPGPVRAILSSRPDGLERPARPAEAQPVRTLLTSVPSLLDPLPLEPLLREPAPGDVVEDEPAPESHPIREAVQEVGDALPAVRETLPIGDGNVTGREPTLLQR